jgi:hypothetical protein
MKQEIKKKEEKFGVRDKVLITYQSKWYDMVDVPGIIAGANRTNGWPFHVHLESADGKAINLGHDNDGGGPGSGPYMHCDAKHMTMVEKYVPKRLDGPVRETWKEGDRFVPKIGLCVNGDFDESFIKVLPEMETMAIYQEELGIATILPINGIDLLIDNFYNLAWIKEWIDPVGAPAK